MTDPNEHTNRAPDAQAAKRSLSALMDGEAAALDDALKAWREDASARQTWHSYQLVGDVMRSEDLARPAIGDLAFLARLRSRLQEEPAWVAPTPVAKPTVAAGLHKGAPHRFSTLAWAAGLAACAVVVAGRLWAPVAGPDVHAVADAATASPLLTNGSTAVVLRDPRLDEFLHMHQMARGGMPVGVPGGSLRNADYAVPSPRR